MWYKLPFVIQAIARGRSAGFRVIQKYINPLLVAIPLFLLQHTTVASLQNSIETTTAYHSFKVCLSIIFIYDIFTQPYTSPNSRPKCLLLTANLPASTMTPCLPLRMDINVECQIHC